MELKTIIEEIEYEIIKGDINHKITGIEHDSRSISQGNIFIAIDGYTVDGHDFIDQALKNGASCVVVEKDIEIENNNIALIKVKDTTKALAEISSSFYKKPYRELELIGVTGTNGKTSITYLIKSIIEAEKSKMGIIGTMGSIIDNQLVDNKNTTPDSLTIEKYLRKMADSQTEYCLMEVSSHALDMNRVANMEFQVGIFTNLSEEHLDYHITMENYFRSKLKLFNMTKKCNIINIDDKYGKKIINEVENNIPIITYGLDENADIYAEDINYHTKGVDFTLNTPVGKTSIYLNLLGEFSVYNALAAVAFGIAYNIDLSIIKKGIESITGIKGRFEIVPIEEDFSVIIDFAHTPDGLEKVLTTIDQFAEGRKIVVFGAGGNRDKTKRPIMGETVAKHADLSIVTSDNPRFEDPDSIIEDVLIGVKKAKGKYIRITDRKEAIKYALLNAKPKDTILLAGKGHETYTIIKDDIIPFDEKNIVLDILKDVK